MGANLCDRVLFDLLSHEIGPKRMPTSHDDGQPRASLLATLGLAFLLINFILWGVAVAIFNGGAVGFDEAPTTRGRGRRGVLIFVIEALTTLPQIGSVIPYIWNNHKWYVGVFCVVEVLLLLFMVWMKKLDQDLSRGSPFKKSRR